MPLEAGIIAALIEAAAIIAQTGANIYSSSSAQNKNEEYYNNYGSPVAIKKQLKDAGLSDAAIGQKIAGTGSGTVLQSVQAQPADLQGGIGDIIEKIQGIKKSGKEIEGLDLDVIQKRLQNESQRLNIKAARFNLAKLPWELKKLKYDAGMSEEAYQVARYTTDNLIKMSDKQLKQMDATLTKTYCEIIGSMYDNDVKKYEACVSNFKYEVSRLTGIPYEQIDKLGKFNDVTSFITLLLEYGLDHQLDEKNIFKKYQIDENGENFVEVYGKVEPKLDKDIDTIDKDDN